MLLVKHRDRAFQIHIGIADYFAVIIGDRGVGYAVVPEIKMLLVTCLFVCGVEDGALGAFGVACWDVGLSVHVVGSLGTSGRHGNLRKNDFFLHL